MISDLTKRLIWGIFRMAKGVRLDKPEKEIAITDLIVDAHSGEPVTLADVVIRLEPPSSGKPIEEECDIVVLIEGEEVERFQNKLPPYTIFPVE